MSAIRIQQPSGTFTVTPPPCLGAFYVVVAGNSRYVANVIDTTPDGRPKRVRIQFDPLRQGDVLMPGEYIIMERLESVED